MGNLAKKLYGTPYPVLLLLILVLTLFIMLVICQALLEACHVY